MFNPALPMYFNALAQKARRYHLKGQGLFFIPEKRNAGFDQGISLAFQPLPVHKRCQRVAQLALQVNAIHAP